MNKVGKPLEMKQKTSLADMKLSGGLEIDMIEAPFIGGKLPSNDHSQDSLKGKNISASGINQNGAAPSLLKNISNLFANPGDF